MGRKDQQTPIAFDAAMHFLHEYAVKHQFFTGGDVLQAFRATGAVGSGINWRNRWGVVMNAGASHKWYRKVGRAVPTSPQSHTKTLARWKSLVYEGDVKIAHMTETERALDVIRQQVYLQKIDLRKALWKAYNLGCEIHGSYSQSIIQGVKT